MPFGENLTSGATDYNQLSGVETRCRRTTSNNQHRVCAHLTPCFIVAVISLLSVMEKAESFSTILGLDCNTSHRRISGGSGIRHSVSLSGGMGMMGRVEHSDCCRWQQAQALLVMGMTATEDEEDEEEYEIEDDEFNSLDDNDDANNLGGMSDFGEEDLEAAGVVLEDLSWRVEKLRLEEANTRRFLKARPRFLPYDECRKWVQAWGRWKSKEDWVRWISMGEKRNSYIPSQPDKYYGRLGVWISWEHFLGVEETNQSS